MRLPQVAFVFFQAVIAGLQLSQEEKALVAGFELSFLRVLFAVQRDHFSRPRYPAKECKTLKLWPVKYNSFRIRQYNT
jgi:hypothetical protein